MLACCHESYSVVSEADMRVVPMVHDAILRHVSTLLQTGYCPRLTPAHLHNIDLSSSTNLPLKSLKSR